MIDLLQARRLKRRHNCLRVFARDGARVVLVADRGKERIVDKRRSFGSNAQEHEGSCDRLNEGGRGEIEKADASGLVGRRCQFDQVAVSDHCSQEFREFAPQVIACPETVQHRDCRV